jgi:hypothetical protein
MACFNVAYRTGYGLEILRKNKPLAGKPVGIRTGYQHNASLELFFPKLF